MNTKPQPPREWRVFVHTKNIGDIGSVMESNEELARCAALSKYGEPHDHGRGDSTEKAIFLDDDFDVRGYN